MLRCTKLSLIRQIISKLEQRQLLATDTYPCVTTTYDMLNHLQPSTTETATGTSQDTEKPKALNWVVVEEQYFLTILSTQLRYLGVGGPLVGAADPT